MILSKALFVYLATAAALWAAFPHDKSDLPPDERVNWGQLENGMRYAIMQNSEPPGRVSLRLFVDAGSLMETDSQAGLAHYLEHMAFNGSTNYPPGELVEYLQRLGMGFGADTNAHVGFDETVYKLELPESTESYLREGLQVLRDYADGLLLLESEIERERGVILSEKRARDSARYRTVEAWFDFAFPESIIAHRLPIGEEAVIQNAHREQFVEFYQTWYQPERMAVVVVGDIEVGPTADLIEAYFASMPENPEPRPDPDLGSIPSRGLDVHLHTEKESTATTLSIMMMAPYERRADTEAERIEQLQTALANRIVSRRIDILAKDESAPFSEGRASSFDFLDFTDVAEIEVTCQPGQWQEALAAAEQILRKALQYGFTKAEVAEAKANMLQGYEQAVREASTRRSRALSASIVNHLSSNKVFTSPEAELALAEKAFAGITPAIVLEAYRKAWRLDDRLVFVSGNLELENAGQTIKNVYSESAKVEVMPPEEIETPRFAYTDFGQPGTIKSEQVHEDLGIHQVVFQNNLRFNFKQTDYEAGQVLVSINFGGGELAMPQELEGIDIFAGSTLIRGGLQAHSYDEIQRILAGKTVGVSFSVDESAFFLSSATTAADTLLQLQLATAYLTAPGYRPEAARLAKQDFEQLYKQLAHTPDGVFQNQLSRLLAGGSYRFGFPPEDTLMGYSMEDVQSWLQQPLADSYLEVNIVGDIAYADARDYVAATLGALPARADRPPAFTGARESVHFPRGDLHKELHFDSEIPRSIAAVFWPTNDFWDIDRTRALNMVAAILRDRLRIEVREALGEGYSPYALSRPSETFAKYGYIMALNYSDPDKATEVAGIISELGSQFAASGTNEDERERILKPLLNHIAVMRRDNTYWLGRVMSGSTRHPEQLDFARTLPTAYQEISIETINAYASEYLGGPNRVQAVITPQLY